MRGIITLARQGWWLVEHDESHELYFVHHSQVYRNRNLYLGDIITFEVGPNPLKPGFVMAINVVWVGKVAPEPSESRRAMRS